MPVDYSIPSWLKPHDPVAAYTQGVALGQGQQRINQAAREHQDQLALQQAAQAAAAQQHGQQNELLAAKIGSQAATQRERIALQRAAQQQKAAEAAVRFGGMADYSKLVSNGVPQEKAFMELAPQMFHGDARGMLTALDTQAKIKEAAAYHATIAAQRADELQRRIDLDTQRAGTDAERIAIDRMGKENSAKANQIREAAALKKAQAEEAKQTAVEVARRMANLNIDNGTALWSVQQERAGNSIPESALKDRADAFRAISDLQILQRAGKKKAAESVDSSSRRLAITEPWFGGEEIGSLLEKYQKKLGQFESPAAPAAPVDLSAPTAPKAPGGIRVLHKESGRIFNHPGTADQVPEGYEVLPAEGGLSAPDEASPDESTDEEA